MATSGIVWRSGQAPSDLAAKIRAFGARFLAAVLAVGTLVAAEAEAHARSIAPWRDITGEARARLTGVAVQLGATAVAIVLYHGAAHGKWLEVAHGSRWAAILPTLPWLYARVLQAISAAFAG
jgi:hypothetical protein